MEGSPLSAGPLLPERVFVLFYGGIGTPAAAGAPVSKMP